jgi:hypothetical protein
VRCIKGMIVGVANNSDGGCRPTQHIQRKKYDFAEMFMSDIKRFALSNEASPGNS